MSRGIDAITGQAMSGDAHIRQSLRDILTTPIGSRVMRRDYGSLVPELIDQPINPSLQLRLVSTIFTAILIWEPRVKPLRVTLSAGQSPSTLIVDIDCERGDEAVTFSIAIGNGNG